MRVYDEFSALWRAPLCHRAFYQDVGLDWKGIALRYLLLIQLLCWLPFYIKTTVNMSSFIEHDAKIVLKEVPKIALRRGHVSSPVEQPYIMKDAHGTPVFVLDTTGTIKSPTEVGARILLTETTLVQVDRSGRVQTNPLTGFPDTDIDADWLISWVKLVRNLMLPVFYPLTVVVCMAWRLLAALVLSLFGLILIRPFGAKLSFAGLMRLSVVSMTTVMMLHTVVQFVGVPIGCFDWLLYPAISLGYVAYAVKVNGDLTKLDEHGFPVEFPRQPPA